MSPSSDSPLDNFFTGLSADQLIAEEEECQTSQPLRPAQPVLGKRTVPPGDDRSDDDGNGGSPSPGDRDSPGHSTSVNPASLHVEQVIQRMAKRLKLSYENTSLVEQFSQVHIAKPQL
jgi:hypothetical protein